MRLCWRRAVWVQMRASQTGFDMSTGERERVERRLAAILAADVAGYSRLMGADEEGTFVALKAIRRELLDPKITEDRGRVVKTTGDGMLVEFQRIVDAVRCAVEVQRGMAERNADVPTDKRIEFRVGINLGDIIIDDGDIFVDGVNIAARLEARAAPGGICVSRVVRDQVRDKLAFNDREQEYFADAITEDLTTDLSRIANRFVIARSTAFTFKGKSVDVKQIGHGLGVRYVLEGSVRRLGDQVQVNM
jgi:adenylate cyclase